MRVLVKKKLIYMCKRDSDRLTDEIGRRKKCIIYSYNHNQEIIMTK